MSDGFIEVEDRLDSYCSVVHNDVRRVLDQAEWLMHDAVRELEGFDDPAASQAIAAVNGAREDVQAVVYGWLTQYVRESQRLVALMRRA